MQCLMHIEVTVDAELLFTFGARIHLRGGENNKGWNIQGQECPYEERTKSGRRRDSRDREVTAQIDERLSR